MAEKRRFLDVWIIETNTVYREVPFEVVTDWVQQGRLLADDMLRPSGTAQWFRLGDNPSFSAYLPQADPYAANDQAEALEPVQVDFAWKRRPEDEDDDVDMIPLIDVSLVLLVFFMMTAGAIAVASGLKLPEAEFNLTSGNENMIWIGIHAVEADPTFPPTYSIGDGEKPAATDDEGLTEKQVLEKLDARLKERGGKAVEVQVRGDETLPAGRVRHLQLKLELRPIIIRKYQRVNEKKS
ncbi:MAG TPA: biopolymer transporter ExbD [Gemmataceae bacterium]|nr:biopolymer transporter ExbD [Gemmataceae bacterium]